VLQPEALLDDPQAKATGILLPYPDESSVLNSMVGLPLKFDGKRPAIIKPAPHRK
jgi:crotonobetainyl-CoA:carnitine CoA-transferase CaiB-like acyl-CoA transferase